MAGTTVSASFDEIHDVVTAVRSLRAEGYRNLTVYGPVMETELEDAIGKPASPVRRYTIIGGIMGGASGFLLTIWSSFYYPLVVGGKSLSSIPAYVVIGFELAILFAGISALIGMLIHNRMPTLKLDPGYDSRFSDDRFGVRVVCRADRASAAEALLRNTGCDEVRVEG